MPDSDEFINSIDPKQLGRDLTYARKKRKMTQDEAARILEVARTTITAIEKGERRLRASELLKLARAYGAQFSDFVRPRPAISPFLTRVQFRGPFSRSSNDDELIEPYINDFEQVCRDYIELEQITGSSLHRRYPLETAIPKTQLGLTADSLAQEERNRLGLGDGPISLLRDILENEVGIRVFFLPMPSKFSEMYVCDDEIGACMAINSNHPEERRRWSMTHAYAHFLTSRYNSIVFVDGQGKFRSEALSERFAEHFTPAFLMHGGGMLRRVTEIREAAEKKLPIGEILRAAHYFGVSPQAYVRRLEDLRVLPSGTWDQMRERVSIREAQKRLGLEEIAGRSDIFPLRYRQLAFTAFEDGAITESQLAHFLRIDLVEARMHYNQMVTNVNEIDLLENQSVIIETS